MTDEKGVDISAYSMDIDKDQIATVVFDMPGKVNVMNEVFMTAMKELVEQLEAQAGMLRGVVITSAKSTFFAGGDLALMLRSEAGRESFLIDHFNALKGYFRRLEKLPYPVVAAINGTALGGGYELCLACHYRIALRNEKTLIGLPEVQFGILPAAGGVVRLAYLLGLSSALPFLLSGKKVDVQAAKNHGLIDDIVATGDELLGAARDWILHTNAPIQRWDSSPMKLNVSQYPLAESRAIEEVEAEFSIAERENPAITEIIRIAHLVPQMAVDQALGEETLSFVKLVLSQNAKQRITQFFELNRKKAS